MRPTRPIVWSLSGLDTAGGAGLSADARAAEAFGVHLCPIATCVTAQNSQVVAASQKVAAAFLDLQLQTLAQDLFPRVIKTGLLADAAQVVQIATWVDRLRRHAPVAVVVDPVLSASSGADFAQADKCAAYRQQLLPRADLITPNLREAWLLSDQPVQKDASVGEQTIGLAQYWRQQGVAALAITGGDSGGSDDSSVQNSYALDWIHTEQASAWLALPRSNSPHTHGTGCTFASSAAAALALGFVAADALVLAKMATAEALRRGWAAGLGPGPVAAHCDFARQPNNMPWLSWDAQTDFVHAWPQAAELAALTQPEPVGLYGIIDTAAALPRAVAAGCRTVQLRLKAQPTPHKNAAHDGLVAPIRAAQLACAAAGLRLVVNDHWRLAAALGVAQVHLGQEDILALSSRERAELKASGLGLGISSHSLWELARARSLTPRYIACGPVWPTTTKRMPWLPQGQHNLAWWAQMAGAPVVAIGGILHPEQLAQAVQAGASGVCLLRALQPDAKVALTRWPSAWQAAQTLPKTALPALPRPSLSG